MIGPTELVILVAVLAFVVALMGRMGDRDAFGRTLLIGLVIVGGVFLGARFLGITLLPLIPIIAILLPVAGAIDAALIPDSTWRAADHNKLVWVGLQAGLAIVLGAGFVTSVIYFLAVRPKLRRVQPTLR
ncbi:MAG: hypothetical protein ACRDKZ_12265 [Actinomycetota bacterium]